MTEARGPERRFPDLPDPGPALTIIQGTPEEQLYMKALKVGFEVGPVVAAAGGLVALGLLYYAAIKGLGFKVTSWWRTPFKNMAIHAAYLAGNYPNDAPTWDWHVFGLAWDVTPGSSGKTMEQVAAALRGLGLRVLNEGTHVHSQLFPVGWI